MSEDLEHARHRTYFLASAIAAAVLAVPGVFVLLLEGLWELNQNLVNFYLLAELVLVVVIVAERSKMHEKE
jgi:hypothetical protein